MSTKDGARRQLTPSERRQREMRKRRIQKRKRQKAIRLAILIAIAVLAVAIIGGIIFAIVKLAGGSDEEIKTAKIPAGGNSYVIMLDAGHGGEDTGLTGETLEEKEVTMAIVSKLKIMFENYGYAVELTRTDDVRMSKEDRVNAVNGSKADLCVSVHLNYSDDSAKAGVETYYNNASDEGAYLAKMVQESAVAETGAGNSGAYAGDFSIVKDTEIPTVLVEVGYFSNAQDAASLTDDAYRNLMAKGIAKGVIRSLATP